MQKPKTYACSLKDNYIWIFCLLYYLSSMPACAILNER